MLIKNEFLNANSLLVNKSMGTIGAKVIVYGFYFVFKKS